MREAGIELGEYQGQVIKYMVDKGFGFIKIKNKVHRDGKDMTLVREKFLSDDAFVHCRDIEPDKDFAKKLNQGEYVIFKLYRTSKGLTAKFVSIHADYKEETNAEYSFNR